MKIEILVLFLLSHYTQLVLSVHLQNDIISDNHNVKRVKREVIKNPWCSVGQYFRFHTCVDEDILDTMDDNIDSDIESEISTQRNNVLTSDTTPSHKNNNGESDETAATDIISTNNTYASSIETNAINTSQRDCNNNNNDGTTTMTTVSSTEIAKNFAILTKNTDSDYNEPALANGTVISDRNIEQSTENTNDKTKELTTIKSSGGNGDNDIDNTTLEVNISDINTATITVETKEKPTQTTDNNFETHIIYFDYNLKEDNGTTLGIPLVEPNPSTMPVSQKTHEQSTEIYNVIEETITNLDRNDIGDNEYVLTLMMTSFLLLFSCFVLVLTSIFIYRCIRMRRIGQHNIGLPTKVELS